MVASGKTHIIACRVMAPEIEAMSPPKERVTIQYMDQGYHERPDRLPPLLQEAVDAAARTADRIVLGYGLCANAVVGVKAPAQGIYVPRVHDCISLFLGSRQAYAEAMKVRPGTYYLTPGWIVEGGDPLSFMEEKYVPRLGRETAEWGIRQELKNYTHLAWIRTAAPENRDLRLRAMENARFLDKTYLEIQGSPAYFRQIIFGPHDAEAFLFIEPGKAVEQFPFL